MGYLYYNIILLNCNLFKTLLFYLILSVENALKQRKCCKATALLKKCSIFATNESYDKRDKKAIFRDIGYIG